ncbi:MAG TPA: prepilin-type N-terminal cleavage/methylation domain-containing protein [Acidimicrobiales bacterium]|nr:prepilin-type N-terminal cleavage/methylation domain-containing protein [Acidimicrobiales bacterium]
MLQALKQRREDDEQGFTLIELMVVVLIIAILLAIAIPTFLGAQNRAKDRAAQSDLRNAITAAKTIATDFEGAFSKDAAAAPIDSVVMELNEASLNFDTAGLTNYISVAVSDGALLTVEATPTVNGVIFFTRKSASGNWYGICADYKGNVRYAADTDATPTQPALADCTLQKF